MPKMIDLKLTKSEKEKQGGEVPCYDTPDYPYGTLIELGTEQLKQMPELADVEDGTDVKIVAMGTVKRVVASSEDGEKERSVSIQLKKIAFPEVEEQAQEALFKGFAESNR